MTNEIIHELLHAPHVVDCEECFFRRKPLKPDGAHCYMFRNPPEDKRCAQFRKHITARPGGSDE